MNVKDIDKIIEGLTLEEKASLCSGVGSWHTQSIEKKGIPAVMVSDGPHGLRKMDLNADKPGVNNSIKAVCFPTGSAVASSFDPELAYRIGQTIGEECAAEKVSVLLGPGVNIKRSPLCGRNFEYYSEDPVLAGNIAASFIEGVQSKGPGACVKHFCANNQEKYRYVSNSIIDERTLREIYLKPFEIAVKKARPMMLMCSYNRVNGVQASENKRLLTDILRGEWEYEGTVVSDWGAVLHRDKALEAGLNLEMPGCGGANDKVIVEAVKKGTLSVEKLNENVRQILKFVFEAQERIDEEASWDKQSHHLLSRRFAAECMVLLKNENRVLPINETDYIALIGGFAKKPRFQGGGSSHINSIKVDSAIEAAQGNTHVIFAEGFSSTEDEYNPALFRMAIETAARVDKAIIYAGLPDIYESEGYDRDDMELPSVQNRLIEEVSKVCPHVIVVLHAGSAVSMPWIDKVDGVILAQLAGDGVGNAVEDVLFGRVNPSGRLAESYPFKVEDNPSYVNFGGNSKDVLYGEGLFVGYRYYTAAGKNVQFPFGYGLSYTKFTYGRMMTDCDEMKDDEKLEVVVEVTNEGSCTGKEVVQLYVSKPKTNIRRPVRELKAFAKVELEPKETKKVTFILEKSDWAYYDTEIDDWYTEPGEYHMQICRNAEEVILERTVTILPAAKKPNRFSANSMIGEILDDEDARELMEEFAREHADDDPQSSDKSEASKEALSEKFCEIAFREQPLRCYVNFGAGKVSVKELNKFIDKLNKT